MSSTNITNADGSRAKVSMKFNERDKSFDAYVQTPDNPRPRKAPRTEEEVDQAFPYHIPQPQAPEPLSQETLDLYRKAIDAPGSLTNEETLSIQDWVSDAVVDERCLIACGITWQALVTIAVERPQDLTSDEASFIQTGRYNTYKDPGADHKRVFGKLRQPEHVKNLWLDAQKATTNPRYAIAKSNAIREDRRICREREEALSHLSEDDISNVIKSTRIPWIGQLTASSKPHWGLVCFRTAYNDDKAWKRYKEHILRSSRTGLWSYPGTDSVTKKWKIEFIEDDKERLDGAGLEDLCRYFNTPPPSSPVTLSTSSGLRSDVFLFADARTISSLDDPASDPSLIGLIPAPGAPPFSTDHLIPGYVNAADASFDSGNTYAHGFKGVLKVHPAHVATTFYHRLKSRGQEQEQGSEKCWKYKQDWETMFMRAHKNGGREGGVYPPLCSYNR